ncbi:XrtA/PEP-CTERM system histidine kinase PrsK [Nitrosospira briensis]|uniref:XrtA/PEP-CTERM system histidine kinase PrsK n=1 Tax=Nitrosospira briensis TaxID=35799 RepID=UPI0008E86534|nr:XrtA/PEP-CTERM system histidine kinase PrsK [Nitrosospira briensis]SFO34856.1 putative PEP-CTERM system histidine kinase [Nitrosospira briensis]
MLASIATFSYSMAAIGHFVLAVLLLTSWRGRLHGMVLPIACCLSALWASMLAYQATQDPPLTLLTDVVEILRNAGWSAFLITLLGLYRHGNSLIPKLSPAMVAIMALYIACLIVALYSHGDFDFSSHKTIDFINSIVGSLAMAILGMILVEQLYRNTPLKQRWGIKFACLGIGGIFAYDFYLYSDALLLRQVNPEIWAARGIVNALVVPLIAISAARNPQWSVGITVSRHILFYSAALFGAAAYLLAMAAAGYYLRFFGGNWGTVMQVSFLFGAVVLLLAVLFSGTLRSWLRVFISKHFFSYNYDYREEWLHFTRTLSEGEHGLGERVIQALAQLVESPGGGLWMRRESGHCEPVTHWNMPSASGSESLDSPFCQFLANKEWVIDLQEYAATPEKYPSLVLPQWLQAVYRAWLVVPLIQDRKLFGFVVLAQPRSRVKLNWEVSDLLKVAGNQAASYLAQHEAVTALMVARQFESFNRMSTFVVHDLKNLVSQLSLLLSNAEKHKKNPEFQKDMIETVYLSVQKMKRLLEKLSSGDSSEKAGPLIIARLLQEAVKSKSIAEPRPILEIQDPNLSVCANSSRLERVVGHLIQNAIDATSRNGQVRVQLRREQDFAIVEIKDTGHGMSEEFIREKLFKPFESTKSAGMGIGVFESREYVSELGGELEVSSSELDGTIFRIVLPLHQTGQQAIKAAT